MNPNAALENILRGHMIADHAIALGERLARQGFAPHETTVPPDPAFFIARHCARHYYGVEVTTIRVRADKAGIWTALPDRGPWFPLGIWVDFLRMEDGNVDEVVRAHTEHVVESFLEEFPQLQKQ